MNIVFIDDQEDLIDVMKMILEDLFSAKVFGFSTCLEAGEYLKKNANEVSLIICDYRLPGEDGIEFYKSIEHMSIPFILMSGMQFSEDDIRLETLLKNTNNRMLLKPVDESELAKHIKEII